MYHRKGSKHPQALLDASASLSNLKRGFDCQEFMVFPTSKANLIRVFRKTF